MALINHLRLLVRNHLGIPVIVSRNGLIIGFRQCPDAIGKRTGIAMIHLECRWCALRIIKRACRYFDLITLRILQAKWRSAITTKPTLAQIGTGKIAWFFMCPLQTMHDDKRRIKCTKCPLAHPAMAHRGSTKRGDSVAHRATLTPADDLSRFFHARWSRIGTLKSTGRPLDLSASKAAARLHYSIAQDGPLSLRSGIVREIQFDAFVDPVIRLRW